MLPLDLMHFEPTSQSVANWQAITVTGKSKAVKTRYFINFILTPFLGNDYESQIYGFRGYENEHTEG
jgi:hypothetical protein